MAQQDNMQTIGTRGLAAVWMVAGVLLGVVLLVL